MISAGIPVIRRLSNEVELHTTALMGSNRFFQREKRQDNERRFYYAARRSREFLLAVRGRGIGKIYRPLFAAAVQYIQMRIMRK